MTSLNDVLLAMSNIPVDDPIAEIWGRGLQGGGYTVIEYTGTLPITITADGSALIDYCIYGTTVQTGTPAPDSPIMPEGVGERTENLWDGDARIPYNSWTIDTTKFMVGGYANSKNVSPSYVLYELEQNSLAVTSLSGGCGIGFVVPVNPSTTYTLSMDINKTASSSASYFGFNTIKADGTLGDYIFSYTTDYTFTTEESTAFVYVVLCMAPSYGKVKYTNIMLTAGSTAPESYIPYGYKLPITINDVEHPIYLGEAETTRRIKKLVLTGEESGEWTRNTAFNAGYAYFKPNLLPNYKENMFAGYCTHYPLATTRDATIGIYVGLNINFITDFSDGIDTSNKWKAYLQQQYAAGTPVTVWYVLAEPETGIVNEPLMKIGDYADTISMEQADVSIPTFAGTTVIGYNDTPKPSEMYIKYRR